VKIDAVRRNLQRGYLEMIDDKINPKGAPQPQLRFDAQGNLTLAPPRHTTDARAMLRAELVSLDGQLRAALPRASDKSTRAHILDARHEIARILKPAKETAEEQ
jgi:Rod binding domain-containing protein